jgi:probable rRNA maturation factor
LSKEYSLRSVKISLQIEPAYRKLVERRQLRNAARLAVQHQVSLTPREPALELAIVITGDEQIQALNRQYRQVDAPTDVLAFATTEAGDAQGSGAQGSDAQGSDAQGSGAQGSGAFVDAPADSIYLGDIIISYPRAEAQAQAGGHLTSAELQLLVVHGVLHLLGHEHATATQKRTMWSAQAEIMQAIGASITGPA